METELAIRVAGRTFVASNADGVLRMRDLELAEWLEYKYPNEIRKLIGRLRSERIPPEARLFNDSEVIVTVTKTSAAGGRPATEFWLSETAAYKVAAKSDTPRANRLLSEIVEAFVEAKRRQRDQLHPASPPPWQPGRVGDNPGDLAELQLLIRHVARNAGASTQCVHGLLRSMNKVPGIKYLSLDRLPDVRRFLLRVANGDLLIPKRLTAPKLAPVIDIRQIILPFPPNGAA